MALPGPKVPVIVASSLICFSLGVGAGATWKEVFSYASSNVPSTPVVEENDEGRGGEGRGSEGRGGRGGMPGPLGGRGMGMMGMGMGGRGRDVRNDLANLITKIDVLSKKPLKLELTDEEKKLVAEQLEGLDKLEELTLEEAEKRRNLLVSAVGNHQATLEAAGYRWPTVPMGGAGGGGGGFGQEIPPNVFADGPNAEHLKSLQAQVSGSKPETK